MKGVVDPARIATIREGPRPDGPVVCWLRRELRARDNWALLYARQLAAAAEVPLAAVFCLVPAFPGAGRRQYEFLLAGARELEGTLAARGIPLFLLTGPPEEILPPFLAARGAGALVADFGPLRIHRRWLDATAARTPVRVEEVDARNVVPCRFASDRREYAARTIRPKIRRLLPRFLTEFPALRRPTRDWTGAWPANDWDGAAAGIRPAADVPPVSWLAPGEKAARRALDRFLRRRLAGYDEGRNDPNRAAQSDLSPYLHFGHLSAQRAALAVAGADAPDADREAFLEQLVVRRELAENYCLHEPAYDRFEGLPAWARRTLADHADDPRGHLYGLDALEAARTHDALWNAAQREMVVTGKMHGYLRMYWAKRILAWSRDPEEAQRNAILLNDRYELDGRDPNGYVGVAWSVGGLHDRPWFERPVFGKVRSMTLSGCRRRFDVDAYVARCARLDEEAGR